MKNQFWGVVVAFIVYLLTGKVYSDGANLGFTTVDAHTFQMIAAALALFVPPLVSAWNPKLGELLAKILAKFKPSQSKQDRAAPEPELPYMPIPSPPFEPCVDDVAMDLAYTVTNLRKLGDYEGAELACKAFRHVQLHDKPECPSREDAE